MPYVEPLTEMPYDELSDDGYEHETQRNRPIAHSYLEIVN